MSYLKDLLEEYHLTGIITTKELHDRADVKFGKAKRRIGWGKLDWLLILEDILETPYLDENIKENLNVNIPAVFKEKE